MGNNKKWYEMAPEEWYNRRKEWLEETAEKQRAFPVKKDCLMLMDYLDEFDQVKYIYKPAIMLSDVEACTGYIPDLMIHIPGDDLRPQGVDLVIDFLDEHNKYYDPEKQEQKAMDLENDGYLYRCGPKGMLSGKHAITPKEFIEILAQSFSE